MKRNRPGTKYADFYNWSPQDLSEMESTLAVQQYIQQQLRRKPEKIKQLIKLPDDQDRNVWIYENILNFLQELTGFILHHKDVCTKEKQPKMQVVIDGEELSFLCSAFKPPQDVPPIDYMVNTIAHATSTLFDAKLFPNRFNVTSKGMKKIEQIARRCYRIFVFSYYAHNELFEEYEAKTHLCERYTRFMKEYDLMPKKEFLIPSSRWKKDKDEKKKRDKKEKK